PCLHVPWSTLHGRRYRSSRLTRGRGGGSPFTVGNLHSFTLCRFVPAHPNAQAHLLPEAGAERSEAEAGGSLRCSAVLGATPPSANYGTCSAHCCRGPSNSTRTWLSISRPIMPRSDSSNR